MEMHHPHHAGTGAAEGDAAAPVPAGRHGMAVVGGDSVYFSHLPMFMMPHDWQLVVRGEFAAPDPATAYREDRAAHPDTRLYTFNPERFVLPDLLPGEDDEPPALTSFSGTLFRNHFEQPPAHPEQPEPIADQVVIDVVDIVHAHKLDPDAPQLDRLEYVLFGKGEERFIAHLITRPPDFDQLIAVAIEGREFSDDELRQGIPLTVPDRANAHEDRLKEGEQGVPAVARMDGSEEQIRLTAVSELYDETSDLKEAM